MSAPSDPEKPGRVLKASESSRTLASSINSHNEELEREHETSSLASTTFTLVDASTQTYWTSEAATQTEHDFEKRLTNDKRGKASPVSYVTRGKAQCHGLFGRVCYLYEAENPKQYPNKIKWFITLTVALAAAAAPLGSAIILRMSHIRLQLFPSWLTIHSCFEGDQRSFTY